MIALTAYGFAELDKESLLIPTAVQRSSFAAAAYQFVPADVSTGPVTITLPSAPGNFTRVGVKLVKAGSGNQVTVAASGSDTFNDDGSTSVALTLLNQGVIAQYETDSGIWWVQGADLPLSQLDARYASLKGATFTGAVIAGVVSPIYGTTVSVNAAFGDHFRVQLLGNATISTPTNPTDAQKITFEIVQDSTGGRTVTWGAGYSFGSASPPALSTAPVRRDLLGFVYSAGAGQWLYAGFSGGF